MMGQLWSFVQQQFENNELFAGGTILMIGGAFFAIIRKWPFIIWGWIKRQSMVVIDIPDKDPAFNWVTKWLSQHNYSVNKARLLTVKTERIGKGKVPKIIFSPAPGTHYLWYCGRFMVLSRERQDPQSGGGENRDPFREYFTIRLLGRDRKIALKLLEDAREIAFPPKERKIQVYQASYNGEWAASTNRSPRALDTILMPKKKIDDLVTDIQSFIDSRDWYVKRGIPYRRGYMFYGPPGNGKTSMIAGLASHFQFDIGNINLRSDNLSDSDLFDAITFAPQNMLILLEDIDCVIKGRSVESEVTFSGLLNSLDGVASPEGQIIIMTTNHIENLDPALIRPGRCDVKVQFNNADREQTIAMFNRFYDNPTLAEEFVDCVKSEVSMAQLQGLFLSHRDSPENSIREMKEGL